MIGVRMVSPANDSGWCVFRSASVPMSMLEKAPIDAKDSLEHLAVEYFRRRTFALNLPVPEAEDVMRVAADDAHLV